MTTDRAFKRRVRARVAETGERYTTARMRLLQADAGSRTGSDTPAGTDPAPHPSASGSLHLGGVHPGLAALRVALTNHGITDPRDDGPLSEALLAGLSGGLATAVMALRYEQADVSTLWLTGWSPFGNHLDRAARRLGVEVDVHETAGAKAAARHLDERLEVGAPVVVWVDEATLGHTGMPTRFAGGSYHTVAVYGTDGTDAVIGDRAPVPLHVPVERLAAARARIRKDRHRSLSLGDDGQTVDLPTAVREALRQEDADQRSGPQGTFSLDAVERLAGRVHDDGTKDGWDRIFPPGPHLWSALSELYRCIQHSGSGGGLARARYADYLDEAAELTATPGLAEVADTYRDLARRWTALATDPLDAHPVLRATRDAVDATVLLHLHGDADAAEQAAQAWRHLDELHDTVTADGFPLDPPTTDELRIGLRQALTDVVTIEHTASDQRRAAAEGC